MTGTCEQIALKGPLDKIRAHYQQDKGISRVTYYREGKSKAYGKIGERMVEWDMSNASLPLVGIYGNFNEDRINRLGFITLNTKCQAYIDSNPEEVEEESDQSETVLDEKGVDESVAVSIEDSDEVESEETTEIPTSIESDISDELVRE